MLDALMQVGAYLWILEVKEMLLRLWQAEASKGIHTP